MAGNGVAGGNGAEVLRVGFSDMCPEDCSFDLSFLSVSISFYQFLSN